MSKLKVFLASFLVACVASGQSVQDQLITLQASDTIGNSRVSINTNFSILALNVDTNAAAIPSSTNVFLLNGTNTTSGGATNSFGPIDITGTVFLRDRAASFADVAGRGQVWVDTNTPDRLMFTDDAGTDFQISFTNNKAGLEGFLTDVANILEDDVAETITADWVNTNNPWSVNEGGSGAATFTDGGVLLGSGTGAFTALGELADGEIIVGDGTTDPVAESGATARTSLGLAIGTNVQAWDTDLDDLADLTIAGDFVNTANPWLDAEVDNSQTISLLENSVLYNDAAPTTDATGEFALDTTITDHQPLVQYYDGGENMSVIAVDTAQLPALDDEIISYDAASDKFIFEAPSGGGGGGTAQAADLTISATDTGLVTYTVSLGTNSVDLQTARAVGGSNPALAQVNQGDHSVLLGGRNNQITTNLDHVVIVGGQDNTITSNGGTSPGGIIVGGINNTLNTEGDNNLIVGGTANQITGTTTPDSSCIVGGNGNTISAGTLEFIGGGTGNSITAGATSFVGGGNGNNKTASGTYDTIVGGLNNDIVITGGQCFIGGGEANTIEGPHNVIVGGESNFIGDNSSEFNCILGGGGPGGIGNIIDPTDADYCTILGGSDNDFAPAGGVITYCLAFGQDVDVTDNSADFCFGFGHDIDLAHEGVIIFNDGELAGSTTSSRDNEIIFDFQNGLKMEQGLIKKSTLAGQTADVGSAQGGLPITTDIIEISTVGTTGDSTTLPSAEVGLEIFIINNGANACDVFPASGDNLGAGVDTASSLAAGNNITYVAYDATNWEVK